MRIADIFKQNNITWAVGASLLLYFKDIVSSFNDIDIVIDEKDVPMVINLLADYEVLPPKSVNTQFKTRTFLQYVINDVEVDIMAGFTIIANGQERYFPLRKEHIQETAIIGNTSIPLHSVDEWKIYYELMGRTEKVRLVERYLNGFTPD